MNATFIYKILYVVLHGAFTILVNFYEFLSNFKEKLLRKLTYRTVAVDNEYEQLYLLVKNLSKVPAHLTVLLGVEEPSYKDLSKLILWCIAAGISFISFYDYRGLIKKNESKLKELVEKHKHPAHHIIWHGCNKSNTKNGFIGKKIHVKVLSVSDSYCNVIESTKQLCHDVPVDKMNIDVIDDIMRRSYEFPDPDLAVSCGKTFSVCGYPPWQIRITEFFSIKTHFNIHCDTFMWLLCKYNKCEQRFGR